MVLIPAALVYVKACIIPVFVVVTVQTVVYVFVCLGTNIIHIENTRCNSVSKFLFHLYMKLNMFRATHRPSSGA